MWLSSVISCLVGLKKILDVAIKKGLARRFIFLLLGVKHGSNDIWLLCGHWADGRKMERGGDMVEDID